ncbi:MULTISPECIES: lysozyme inhibitor LprI family protein [Burkholderia cepacia complex]|uniref:lysozyme inhibitor LprI family protein n=1 Tax=Burkholderia cepacia complex TaxID=87882 RepID=UPI00158161CC|nr:MULTISPECIES: lysozyme inhibitor LprI family protein [Burkholderia cepacia complex]
MKRRTLSMILCLVAASFTTMANSQAPVCHNDGSGADSAVCAHQGFVRADAQLNDAYRAALDLLGADTERADARAALVAAQRQWIKFRDADCQVQDRIFQHGTLRAAIVESCLTNLTEQRTTELKKLWLP